MYTVCMTCPHTWSKHILVSTSLSVFFVLGSRARLFAPPLFLFLLRLRVRAGVRVGRGGGRWGRRRRRRVAGRGVVRTAFLPDHGGHHGGGLGCALEVGPQILRQPSEADACEEVDGKPKTLSHINISWTIKVNMVMKKNLINRDTGSYTCGGTEKTHFRLCSILTCF